MSEQMEFPITFEEFAKEYGFKDKKEIYTNGGDLIPIFRVKQWIEHDNKLRKIETDTAYECGKHANKWISVSERLPETDNKNEINNYNVLLWVKNKNYPEREPQIYLGKLRYINGDDGSGNFWGIETKPCNWTIWGWCYFNEPDVLAWMPLPKPYKESEVKNMTFEDKAEIVISQLRADRDRLQNIIEQIRAEIDIARFIDKDTKLCKNANASGLEVAMQIIDKYKA